MADSAPGPDDPQAPRKPAALRLHEVVASLTGGAVEEQQRGVLTAPPDVDQDPRPVDTHQFARHALIVAHA